MEDDKFDVKALVTAKEGIESADNRAFSGAKGAVHIDRIDALNG